MNEISNPAHQKQILEKRSQLPLLLAVTVIIVLLLGIIGYMIWMQFTLSQQNVALQKDKNQEQSKINDLASQLAAAQKTPVSTPAPSPVPAASICNNNIGNSLKANIQAAVSSKNTSALQGYMASMVNVVVAASGKTGSETSAQATSDLSYLSSASSAWSFNLSSSTLNDWKSHFYGQYFSATTYAGQASSGQVVSFDFDCDGKISQIFMAASSDLLTQ